MTGYVTSTGIPGIGQVPWGSHFCQFFKSREDLVHSLVPFFITGLESNERCLWGAGVPLEVDDALTELKKAYPGSADCLKRGQLEIVDHREWYKSGGSDQNAALLKAERAAVDQGFAGLRCAGNISWLMPADRTSFDEYEGRVSKLLRNRRIVALCSYEIAKCTTQQVATTIHNHEFALGRRNGDWELIETAMDLRRNPC